MPNKKKKKCIRLGDLQLRIMKVLWTHGDCSVHQVIAHLDNRSNLAYTTIATMLRKMETKNLVSHRTEGRTFIYQARLAADEVSRSMTDHLVELMFQGSLTNAVHHLLSTRDVSRDELAQLEKLIAKRKKSL